MSTSPIASDRAAIASMRATLLADQIENASSKSAPGAIVETSKNGPITDVERGDDPRTVVPDRTVTSQGAQAARRGNVVVARSRAPQLTKAQQQLRREIEKSSDVVDPWAKQPATGKPALPYNPPSGL